MISFRLHDIANPMVHQALRKMYHCTTMDVKTGYWVDKLVKRVEKEHNKMLDLMISVHKNYGVWDEEKHSVRCDEKGNAIPPEGEGKEAEHDAKIRSIGETVLEIQTLHKIHVDKLGSRVGLSPAEIGVLSPFLDGLPTEQELEEAKEAEDGCDEPAQAPGTV